MVWSKVMESTTRKNLFYVLMCIVALNSVHSQFWRLEIFVLLLGKIGFGVPTNSYRTRKMLAKIWREKRSKPFLKAYTVPKFGTALLCSRVADKRFAAPTRYRSFPEILYLSIVNHLSHNLHQCITQATTLTPLPQFAKEGSR